MDSPNAIENVADKALSTGSIVAIVLAEETMDSHLLMAGDSTQKMVIVPNKIP